MTVTESVKTFLMLVGAGVILLGAANAYLGVPLPGGGGAPAVPPAGGGGTPSAGPEATGPQDTATDASQQESDDLDREQVEKLVFEYVNGFRSNNSAPEVLWDRSLRTVARGHSEDMAENDYLGHEDSDGQTHDDRYREAGYNCGGVSGENVLRTWAFTQVDMESGTRYADTEQELARMIVDIWKNSPKHRELMLQEEYSRLGVGLWFMYEGSQVEVYATANFCEL